MPHELALSETRSTCCYCGVGCGVLIRSDGEQVIEVQGDPAHPANFGKLCSKGSSLHLTAQPVLQQQVRALYPSLRSARHLPRETQSWEQVLEHMAERFASTIAQHGADSVGFYISGQLLTEDYYVFNKLAKGLIGTNNIDSNSRLCMSSAVAGYKQSLGADAPPCNYEDIDHANVIFIAGSNTAFAHPILYRRIEAARERNPELKVIVVDPRRTDTAKEADLHLAILPGTDVALFNGMLHICLWDELIDSAFIADHTEGFAELKQTVRAYTPTMVAQTCGIKEEDLIQAAHWFAQSKATLSLYCQGLNQSTSGTAKNTALINLHLATAQIGKPGAGPFSLTGQPNAMGGREVGGMANLLSAHRDLSNPAHRLEVAAHWGIPEVPAQPGKTAVELFEALRDGSIKIIWIVCTNPAQSMPDQTLIRAALENAELVIVQEAYQHTATVAYAATETKPGTQNFGTLQTAYMAPTEILAKQHFKTLFKFFQHYGINIQQVLGSTPAKQKEEIIINSATLVSSLVPQGLVLITTLSFAYGAMKIAKNQAIVQRLSAIEAMANVKIVCMDKTGTLTKNQLEVKELESLE